MYILQIHLGGKQSIEGLLTAQPQYRQGLRSEEMLFCSALAWMMGFVAVGSMYTPCCNIKTVGGITYSLVDEDADISGFDCISNCVYQRNSAAGSRFCFAKGTKAVSCGEGGSGLKKVFELKEEFNIAKGFMIGTLPYLGKRYKINFEWFITGFGSGWQNIIHFTLGGDNVVYGDRTPLVSLFDQNQIAVWSAIEPGVAHGFAFAAKTKTWVTMEISQYMVADNKFEFDIKIDGKSVGTVPNSRPEAFSKIQMFAANPWHTALNGKIRNFQVQTRDD